MEYRPLGSTPLCVSALGLGCNNFGVIPSQQAAATISRALDAGINFFDTADVYADGESERTLGHCLRGRREQVVLATKFGHPASRRQHCAPGSRAHVLQAAEASLRRLSTDYIDLYLIHFPDVDTPIDETLTALDDLVRQGKVRHIGCSNFDSELMQQAVDTALAGKHTPLAAFQCEYNLLSRGAEAALIPTARRLGLGLLPFFPLASGLLTGKYRGGALPEDSFRPRIVRQFSERFLHEENLRKVELLREFCAGRGWSMAATAIAWLLTEPLVGSVIAGATHPRQVEENVRSLELQIGGADLAELRRLTA
jgi:aryl-alcohol dehydrogenase-like predicted oxidoreductase